MIWPFWLVTIGIVMAVVGSMTWLAKHPPKEPFNPAATRPTSRPAGGANGDPAAAAPPAVQP